MQGLVRSGPKFSKTPREVPQSIPRVIGETEGEWSRERRLERVEDTWEGYGHRIKPFGGVVFVRTDSPMKVSPGGIIIPQTSRSFYSGLPKKVVVVATVVAAGPKVDIRPGDRVMFLRLDFAWIHKFRDDDSFLGYCRDDDGSVLLLADQMPEE